MRVRESTENDFPIVSKIISSVFSEDLQMITGRVVDENLILPFIKGYDVYVSEEENRILGVIVISKRKLKFSSSIIWFYLKNFGVIVSVKSYLRLLMFRKKMPKKLENEYFIEAIAVDRDERNKGIGRQLLVNIEKMLKSKKVKHLGLVVKSKSPANEFYKSLGFTKVKDCVTPAFGEWNYMRKEIG
ncbi:MAG: GNAT family N-acetyltransferase [Candidatus Thermoplasmatota archaeon]|nr:GNAT family N-acetyltransferase [Candidatus Thermoplasmatota archaeon]MCG2825308.1 GNAT family N-acetyltransferase [Thermoplasmatales archaeon]